MKLGKKILKTRQFKAFICWLVHKYILLVRCTSRWDVRGLEVKKQIESADSPCIFAFWHGRLLMIPAFAPDVLKIHALVSNHNDGDLVARTLANFGFELIRGSTGKEGLSSIRSVLKVLKNKECVSLTPDGPKGPRMRVSGAIINLAQMSGCPIVPISYSVNNCKIMRSWDRFMLAKPFAKGCVIYGEPFYVKKAANPEELKKAGIELAHRLNYISNQADLAVGIEPIVPSDEAKNKRK